MITCQDVQGNQLEERPRPLTVLRSNALLKALDASELDDLASVCRVVRATRSEVLWLAGSQVDFIGLAATGWVKMVRGNTSGSDTTIELFGAGQIFGLMGTITGTGCPLTAVAVTDLWYLRIPKRAMLDIYERSVPLKDQLIKKTAIRLHGAVDLMARMSNGTVEQRIAAILFVLAESYGVRDESGLRLQVPLTRQEISEMAGTTVESTIRVMSRWQKQGIVVTDRQSVQIADEPSLSKLLSN